MKEVTWPIKNQYGVKIPNWVGDWRIASYPCERLIGQDRTAKMRVGVDAHKEDFDKMLRSGNR